VDGLDQYGPQDQIAPYSQGKKYEQVFIFHDPNTVRL
jgi:hypothetical protein